MVLTCTVPLHRIDLRGLGPPFHAGLSKKVIYLGCCLWSFVDRIPYVESRPRRAGLIRCQSS
jgi:hypothetical protein